MDETLVMDEVMDEINIGGCLWQHRRKTWRRSANTQEPYSDEWVVVVRPLSAPLSLEELEAERLADWLKKRRCVAIFDRSTRRYKGYL